MNKDTIKYLANDCKVYIDVIEERSKSGQLKPRSFVWEDGNTYEIDSVLHICRAAILKAGGAGLRYTVKIQGRERYMFLEDEAETSRWFMERRT
jgi:hypothetical protein